MTEYHLREGYAVGATGATYLTLDTLDDRREVWRLLHRLPPADRLAVLEACCRSLARPGRPCPVPVPEMARVMVPEAARCGRADDRLTNAIYLDLLNVAANFGLDLVAVARDLEAVAAGRHPAFLPADFRRAYDRTRAASHARQ